jgi:hypothetical protein
MSSAVVGMYRLRLLLAAWSGMVVCAAGGSDVRGWRRGEASARSPSPRRQRPISMRAQGERCIPDRFGALRSRARKRGAFFGGGNRCLALLGFWRLTMVRVPQCRPFSPASSPL